MTTPATGPVPTTASAQAAKAHPVHPERHRAARVADRLNRPTG